MENQISKHKRVGRFDLIWLFLFLTSVFLTLLVRTDTGNQFNEYRGLFDILTIVFGLVMFLSDVSGLKRIQDHSKEKLLSGSSFYSDSTSYLQSLPVVGPLLIWINKRDHQYPLLLSLLFGIGLAIRLHNLAELPPYADEYAHLLAAREMYLSDSLLYIPSYTRSLFLVTLPVYISFSVLEPTLFAARAVIVLFNMLTVFPLYFIVKRINRTAAFVSVFLYISSPWVIATSRTVREYAVLPFYFLLIAFLMITILERVGTDFALKSVIQGQKGYRITWVILLVPIVYAVVVDPGSTFIFSYGLYGVFFAMLIARMDWYDRFNQLSLILLLAIVVVGIDNILLAQSFLSITPQYQSFAIGLFFDDPVQQWYLNRSLGLVGLLTLFGMLYAVLSRHTVALFSSTAFVGYLYAFLFHFDRYTRPRYAFYIEIWYIITLAVGIYLLSRYLSTLTATQYSSTAIQLVVILCIMLAIVNPAQSVMAINLHNEYDGEITPITEEYHVDAEEGLTNIDSYASQADTVLIHRSKHLEWYYPEVYENSDVRYYRCTDGFGSSSSVNDRYTELADDRNMVIITSARSNRNQCIETHPNLDGFQQVSDTPGYAIYTNFEP